MIRYNLLRPEGLPAAKRAGDGRAPPTTPPRRQRPWRTPARTRAPRAESCSTPASRAPQSSGYVLRRAYAAAPLRPSPCPHDRADCSTCPIDTARVHWGRDARARARCALRLFSSSAPKRKGTKGRRGVAASRRPSAGRRAPTPGSHACHGHTRGVCHTSSERLRLCRKGASPARRWRCASRRAFVQFVRSRRPQERAKRSQPPRPRWGRCRCVGLGEGIARGVERGRGAPPAKGLPANLNLLPNFGRAAASCARADALQPAGHVNVPHSAFTLTFRATVARMCARGSPSAWARVHVVIFGVVGAAADAPR